tara:strand:+ start:9833 stop:10882 length:1050 start_codon:yes stop_codon:yes gene_type:complete
MNKLDNQYKLLLNELLEGGVGKEDRTGTGTLSVFGRQIRHNMKDGFPLITTKKMAIKTMMTELKWFLKGDTNIKYLVDNGCSIWNGDAYKAYLDKETTPGIPPHDFVLSRSEFIDKIKTDDEFAKKWGELGPIYGKQWRSWRGHPHSTNPNDFDQIEKLIQQLRTNPDSRRLMVSAWNVGQLDDMVLPPCHYGFQVYTTKLTSYEREDYYAMRLGLTIEERYELHANHTTEDVHKKMDEQNVPKRAISLMWNQRSVDTFLGLPFNIASYGMLLELLAWEVNMVADELIGNLGDVHLYNNHIEQATEQIDRTLFELPTIEVSNVDILNGEFDYEIKDYQSHPTIKAPLSN